MLIICNSRQKIDFALKGTARRVQIRKDRPHFSKNTSVNQEKQLLDHGLATLSSKMILDYAIPKSVSYLRFSVDLRP